MSTYRNDDVEAFITEATRRASGDRKRKPVQQWTGGAVAATGPNPDDARAFADALHTTLTKNKRWTTYDDDAVVVGEGYVYFWGTYQARGANANDAEKLLKSVASRAGVSLHPIDDKYVAVHTHAILPVAGE